MAHPKVAACWYTKSRHANVQNKCSSGLYEQTNRVIVLDNSTFYNLQPIYSLCVQTLTLHHSLLSLDAVLGLCSQAHEYIN